MALIPLHVSLSDILTAIACRSSRTCTNSKMEPSFLGKSTVINTRQRNYSKSYGEEDVEVGSARGKWICFPGKFQSEILNKTTKKTKATQIERQ